MNATPSLSILRPRLQLPVISGNIERRMLLNFQCEPKTIARILPQPFRPKLVSGYAMAGICLIRLENIKPAFLSGGFGFKSENAAHRIAVEWDENGRRREGVFIPRRDTDSRLNTFAGGRLFPGIHHAAEFRVLETEDRFELEMNSDDGSAFVRVDGRVAENFSSQSVFRSLMEASEFFQGGALGWSDVSPQVEKFMIGNGFEQPFAKTSAHARTHPVHRERNKAQIRSATAQIELERDFRLQNFRINLVVDENRALPIREEERLAFARKNPFARFVAKFAGSLESDDIHELLKIETTDGHGWTRMDADRKSTTTTE